MPDRPFSYLLKADFLFRCAYRDKCLVLETQGGKLDSPRLDFLSVFMGTIARLE